MRKVAAALMFVVSAAVFAHPSTGIVITASGEVFYSDLEQVWRVLPDGRKTVAVRNVHAHELALEDGAVIGEDTEWLGGDRYRHRIFKFERGRVSDVVPWTNGFYRAYGLTRDGAGARYSVDCTPQPNRRCTIRKRDRGGRVTSLVTGGSINWIHAAPSGGAYYIESDQLRRVDGTSRVSRVATIGKTLFGLTIDAAGNVYVAAWNDRTVVRVAPNGTKQVVARSVAPWAPSGAAVAPNGQLWVLEWNGTQSRVRRVAR
jgi:hypothetical protein